MEADGLRGNDRGECTLGKRQRRKRERLCHVEFSLVYRLRRSILQGGTNANDAANWRSGRFGIAERGKVLLSRTAATISTTLGKRQSFSHPAPARGKQHEEPA